MGTNFCWTFQRQSESAALLSLVVKASEEMGCSTFRRQCTCLRASSPGLGSTDVYFYVVFSRDRFSAASRERSNGRYLRVIWPVALGIGQLWLWNTSRTGVCPALSPAVLYNVSGLAEAYEPVTSPYLALHRRSVRPKVNSLQTLPLFSKVGHSRETS